MPWIQTIYVCTGKLPKSYLITCTHTVKLDQSIAPELKSLSFRGVGLYSSLHQRLLEILEERHYHNIGLESLVVQSCRVPTKGCEADLEDFVENVTWDNAIEIGSDYGRSESEAEKRVGR